MKLPQDTLKKLHEAREDIRYNLAYYARKDELRLLNAFNILNDLLRKNGVKYEMF